MVSLYSLILIVHVYCCCFALLEAQPVEIAALNATSDGSCSPINTSPIQEDLRLVIRDQISAKLDAQYGPVNGCGGDGWTKISDLDMSDTSQTCPSNNWLLVDTASVRGCGKSASGTCQSAIFPSGGRSYTQVCGQINAIQFGSTDALHRIFVSGYGIEAAYVDGVSLTYGSAGSRQHIWTFAAAFGDVRSLASVICACSNRNAAWPYTIPAWIGNNYFCGSGNRGPESAQVYYSSDPLWDGQGCGLTSDCCQLNNSPWFLASLLSPTSDDIEARICRDESVATEDIVVTKIKIYVK